MTDDTPETQAPLIQLDFPRYDFSCQFDSHKALRDWIDNEILQWRQMAQQAAPFKPWGQARLGQYTNILQRVRDPADALTTNLDEQQLTKERKALDVALAGLTKNELIPTESPIGRMVFAAMERGDVETAFGHLLWESPVPAVRNAPTNLWPLLRGVINAKVSETIGEEAVEAREVALTTQRDIWNATFVEIANAQRAEAESWKTDHKAADEVASALDQQHLDTISAHKETMRSIEQVFAEGLRLKAPVTYWKTKHRRHKIAKFCYLGLFLLRPYLFFLAWRFFQTSCNLLRPQ